MMQLNVRMEDYLLVLMKHTILNEYLLFIRHRIILIRKNPHKHSAAGIGSRHSWFKLDQLDIEGLRQCFADPEVRIQLMGMHGENGYSKIIGMKVGANRFLAKPEI